MIVCLHPNARARLEFGSLQYPILRLVKLLRKVNASRQDAQKPVTVAVDSLLRIRLFLGRDHITDAPAGIFQRNRDRGDQRS